MENLNSEVQRCEIIADRFYFATVKTWYFPDNDTSQRAFSIDNDLVYENFYNDFGPLNICMVYRYCHLVAKKLEWAINSKKSITHYTTTDEKKRANAAFLVGAFTIICLDGNPNDAMAPLIEENKLPYADFCDASYGNPIYKISIRDCLDAIYKAKKLSFFDIEDFMRDEYEYYERVENGDLNWIVPEKFLAFCGPQSKSKIENGYPYHAPETYFSYFRFHNVKIIVRLNIENYDAKRFMKAGFAHRDLYFVDGSTPSDSKLIAFLTTCESCENGAIAVHCKAGLGRTGSLIGAYMIKHYGFTALEAIAWLRLCRPGSVINHQQQWLKNKEKWLQEEGEKYYCNRPRPVHKFPIYSKRQHTILINKFELYEDCMLDHTMELLNTKQETEIPLKDNDKVTNISQRVDTMKINDNENNVDGGGGSDDGNSSVINNNIVKSLKNDNNKISASTSGKTSEHVFYNNIISIEQTQGDKLNQIKASRRRHSRSANITSKECRMNEYRHTRAKSQTVRKATPCCVPVKTIVGVVDTTSGIRQTNCLSLYNRRMAQQRKYDKASPSSSSITTNLPTSKSITTATPTATTTTVPTSAITQSSHNENCNCNFNLINSNIRNNNCNIENNNLIRTRYRSITVTYLPNNNNNNNNNNNTNNINNNNIDNNNETNYSDTPVKVNCLNIKNVSQSIALTCSSTSSSTSSVNSSKIIKQNNSKTSTTVSPTTGRRQAQNAEIPKNICDKFNGNVILNINERLKPNSDAELFKMSSPVLCNNNNFNTNIKTKRGKRSLSSTRVETEHNDEKCVKLLRKNGIQLHKLRSASGGGTGGGGSCYNTGSTSTTKNLTSKTNTFKSSTNNHNHTVTLNQETNSSSNTKAIVLRRKK